MLQIKIAMVMVMGERSNGTLVGIGIRVGLLILVAIRMQATVNRAIATVMRIVIKHQHSG